MNTNVVQRWREGSSCCRPAGELIETSRYEVASIEDDNTAKRFVIAEHYSSSYPAARFRYGLYRSSRLVGVAVFSQPCNDLALRPLPDLASSVELGRFVLLDDVPGNGETFFLARAFELLRKESVTGVVSFSDPMVRTRLDGTEVFGGHLGTIYQAHNAVYLGQARADTLRLLPDGRALHNRAVAKVRGREQGWRYVVKGLVERYGADEPRDGEDLRAWIDDVVLRLTRRARHPGNLKYVWGLDRRTKKALPASKPYPKWDTAARHVSRLISSKGRVAA